MLIDINQTNLKLYYYYLEKALEAAKRLAEACIIPDTGESFPQPIEILTALLKDKITKETVHLYTFTKRKME
jgi:hypothetical protein